MAGAVLEATRITKRFPGVLAVNDMDLTIRAGEIHCLVGENGAGKSTLIKILAGEYPPDSGELRLGGAPARFAGPLDARHAGISIIHQELQLVPGLSIAENVVLGRWPTAGGLVDRAAARSTAAAALRRIGLDIDPETPVSALSTAQQQLVEIARALSVEARLLVLDEPTASLSGAEVERLFEILLELKRQGLGILYVSHRLEEVFTIGDTVTVIRDGERVGTHPLADLGKDDVVSMMIGRQTSLFVRKEHTAGGPLIRVEGLTRHGAFEDVSLEIRRGEVVGLGGLVGAGRTEVARCLFGLDPADAGSVMLDGREVRIDTPRVAIRHGLALVPEDRKTQGLVLILSVGTNLAMSAWRRVSTAGWIRRRDEAAMIADYVARLRIRTPSAAQIVGSLSGGNQQKVVLARWLATRPRLLILDEPTRGVDVGAKAEIHRLVEELVRGGLGVLVISSDLPELIAMSDRVYVMRRGRVVAELAGDEIGETEIMRHAAGAADSRVAAPA